MMRIAIYALAKNEAANVDRWEASGRDADVRVVTDTGSTDDTIDRLHAAGVGVVSGAPVPWRWDDAHNLSLMHLPADVDVAIRLDLDEALDPGWRAAIEAAWTPETTKLRYWYQWSDAVRFLSDRVHLRAGYRWTGATHEGLVRWGAPEVQTMAEGLTIRHHRQPGKRHTTDLTLLRQAVAEAPGDARMAWYLARELDYAADPEADPAFRRYLEMPGGAVTERAYACRVLARLNRHEAKLWLLRAIQESPREPEAYLAISQLAHALGDHVSTLCYARQAAFCPQASQTHASEPEAYGAAPFDLAAIAASKLGLWEEAAQHAREAVVRCGGSDARIVGNMAYIEKMATEAGPKAA